MKNIHKLLILILIGAASGKEAGAASEVVHRKIVIDAQAMPNKQAVWAISSFTPDGAKRPAATESLSVIEGRRKHLNALLDTHLPPELSTLIQDYCSEWKFYNHATFSIYGKYELNEDGSLNQHRVLAPYDMLPEDAKKGHWISPTTLICPGVKLYPIGENTLHPRWSYWSYLIKLNMGTLPHTQHEIFMPYQQSRPNYDEPRLVNSPASDPEVVLAIDNNDFSKVVAYNHTTGTPEPATLGSVPRLGTIKFFGGSEGIHKPIVAITGDHKYIAFMHHNVEEKEGEAAKTYITLYSHENDNTRESLNCVRCQLTDPVRADDICFVENKNVVYLITLSANNEIQRRSLTHAHRVLTSHPLQNALAKKDSQIKHYKITSACPTSFLVAGIDNAYNVSIWDHYGNRIHSFNALAIVSCPSDRKERYYGAQCSPDGNTVIVEYFGKRTRTRRDYEADMTEEMLVRETNMTEILVNDSGVTGQPDPEYLPPTPTDPAPSSYYQRFLSGCANLARRAKKAVANTAANVYTATVAAASLHHTTRAQRAAHTRLPKLSL